ncbi:penicillin-binding transpeptidase domain-containing protein [Streptomyces sp. ACA25]|nr:penicillin-binding transpeptidase domain-containing protein [Streptomyces sp. ACA25]MDB1087272.1 penicillin-binding transpeptidase domain-containing protein [Streptomyces sp. ACA25]
MRDGQRVAVISGACAVVVAVAGVGAYALLGGEDDASALTGSSAGAEQTEAPTDAEVAEVSAAFLAAWAGEDATAAAALTDDSRAAETALTRFAEDTLVSELTLTGDSPTGASVPFTVDARVVFEEEPADWSYASELTVVRDAATGDAVVDWRPEVLHPQLGEDHRIETGPVGDFPPLRALDLHGDELSAEDFPSLSPVLAELAERYADQAGGSRGAEIRIVDAEGERTAQLMELTDPVPGEVPTTIDPAVQRAAEAAVQDQKHAAVVAVQPSTGAILAVADVPSGSAGIALNGSYAPGSTWKVVSGGLLLGAGLAAPDAPHPCPQFFEHGGWEFQNLDEFEIENGTFATSFARSCNTAFISRAPELSDEQLGTYARDAFGIGLDWQVGVPSHNGTVPVESQAQMAAQLIGQAGVRANPMVMASVSATVKSGVFRQPYLVPPSFDGRDLARAPGPSAETAQQLRGLLNFTATSGTAAEAMAGLDGEIGGKTGSAEVMDQDKPNAWFTAYRNDLAVAAMVSEIGHGGTYAGPIVAQVLRVGS